jgi:WS/DGAT/MGAT family acyltransferase
VKALDRLAGVERLRSLDAGFLAVERPTTPMHFGSLTYLDSAPLRDEDGRIRLDELRRLVDERLALAARFRQRPVPGPLGLGRPIWVEDPHFDVADHVLEVVLPAPGSREQLRELCAGLLMRPLDRSRSPWELWVIDGAEGGGVILLEKIHHAMMDGLSGVDVAMLLTDPTEHVEHVAPVEHVGPTRPGMPGRPARQPGTATRLVTGLVDDLGVPVRALASPLRLGAGLLASLREPQRAAEAAREIGRLATGTRSLLRRSTIAPRTPLNEKVGDRRTYDHVEVPLDAVRTIAAAHGCTVNDVALAAVTGGIRRLLLDRGEEPGTRFQVAVPVSTRSAGEHLGFGNRLALFLVPLPVGIDDGLARLEAIRDATRSSKEAGQADAVAALVAAADDWPMLVVDTIAHLVHYQPFANAMVTNVPGPPAPRYLLGSRVRVVAPILPLAGNLDLSVAVFSYDGSLSFGCLADADRCPDVSHVTEGIRDTVGELQQLPSSSGPDTGPER